MTFFELLGYVDVKASSKYVGEIDPKITGGGEVMASAPLQGFSFANRSFLLGKLSGHI